jgi:hypothetical protein
LAEKWRCLKDMISWIMGNIGTIVVASLLIIAVTGIIISMIRDKKQGRSSCGGNCAHCKMCASCKTAEKHSGSPG